MATWPDDIEAYEATKTTESSEAIPLPTKATKSKAKKKTLDEILALIPDLKNVFFDPSS